jgi:tetratricopeptide (TPR) repeat protein
MITSAWNTKRRMVPRWRSLDLTLRSNELGAARGLNTRQTSGAISPELQQRLERWRLSPTLLTAAELVETAIVEGQEDEAVKAARSLLQNYGYAAPLVRQQAAQLLVRGGHAEDVPEDLVKGPEPTTALWRRRTRLHPQDALAWVELSLQQTISGNTEQAHRAMIVALQLAPGNRHVLRSASRLFLHLGDPEQAHDLLIRSPTTKNDPWLIAAEITLSELAERDPRFYKQGLGLIENGGLMPRHITELAGAVGTAELIGGSKKKARKMFSQSMVDPTGNALAQAEWASPLFSGELVPPSRFRTVQEAFEANALHHYREGKFEAVPTLCESWASEEPYSIRPYEFGSATAGLIEEYEKADELGRLGLSIRPGSPLLINCRVFALASMGKISLAEELLHQLSSDADEKQLIVAKANRGLIAFRKRNLDDGKRLYNEAIQGFLRVGDPYAAASARVYFAREAILANAPEAPALLSAAKKAADKFKGGGVTRGLRQVEDVVARLAESKRYASGTAIS